MEKVKFTPKAMERARKSGLLLIEIKRVIQQLFYMPLDEAFFKKKKQITIKEKKSGYNVLCTIKWKNNAMNEAILTIHMMFRQR